MKCIHCGEKEPTLNWICDDCGPSIMPKLIVGLCGRARHGKDSTAEVMKFFIENRGFSCYLSTISGAVLRDAYYQGLIPHQERSLCTPAELDLLVKHGHAGRLIDEDYWIRQVSLEILNEQPDVALIPGVRFPNEINWLRQANGFIIRIVRFNHDGSLFIARDRDPNDPMETVLNRVVADFEISAKTGQEDWLKSQGRALASHLLQGVKNA